MAKKQKVKIDGDKPESSILKAKIPTSLVGDKINFPHRHLAHVDTGVSIVAPSGYRLCFSLVPELTKRGMVATNAPGGITEGNVEVSLLNCGREIVEVKNGDPLVNVWLEKINDFDWE